MTGRRLDAEEQALWRRVAATVRPIGGQMRALVSKPVRAEPAEALTFFKQSRPSTNSGRSGVGTQQGPGETLDGGWDRRLRQGAVAPERSIDLHGHTLASAHTALDHALERAIADDVRLLLVVTGKAPKAGETRRGLIRAAIGDWLASSRHAGRIAAIRNAHPRHGGAGALYLVLRRRRGG